MLAQCSHSVRTVLERKTSGVRTQPPPVYPFLAPPSPPTHPKVCFCFIRELVAFVWFRGSRASRANMGHTESRRQGVCRRCSSGSTRRRMTLQSKSGVAFSAASLATRSSTTTWAKAQGPRPPFTAQWRSYIFCGGDFFWEQKLTNSIWICWPGSLNRSGGLLNPKNQVKRSFGPQILKKISACRRKRCFAPHKENQTQLVRKIKNSSYTTSYTTSQYHSK